MAEINILKILSCFPLDKRPIAKSVLLSYFKDIGYDEIKSEVVLNMLLHRELIVGIPSNVAMYSITNLGKELHKKEKEYVSQFMDEHSDVGGNVKPDTSNVKKVLESNRRNSTDDVSVNSNEVDFKESNRNPWYNKTSTFWGTLIGAFMACTGGAYVLGINIGGFRFDKEKAEYYESNSILRNDTAALRLRIRSDSIALRSRQKTIDSLKEDNNILLLYLGSFKERSKMEKETK